MSATLDVQVSAFGTEVAEGLSHPGQKQIPAKYFYDDLGSALFEAITYLPEYGLTRADERLLETYSKEIFSMTGPISTVAELGSGTGRKTRHILAAVTNHDDGLIYMPIDVSLNALAQCEKQLGDLAQIRSIYGDWMEGLKSVTRLRAQKEPILLLFLGSSIGNLPRTTLINFLTNLGSTLRPGDFFLLGADLIKDVDAMIAAYDDPTGVTAAFNLNVLARINRELDADFDLRSFAHEVRWNSAERRIEMHLLSCRDQIVNIQAIGLQVGFRAGETIWTESSHKFTQNELDHCAKKSGFTPIANWVDDEWPFVEALWRVN